MDDLEASNQSKVFKYKIKGEKIIIILKRKKKNEYGKEVIHNWK